MTPGHMTDVILAIMMTAEVVAAVDVTRTIMVVVVVVVDGTTTGQEIMTEETVTVVVMVEIGMMTGGTKGRQKISLLVVVGLSFNDLFASILKPL